MADPVDDDGLGRVVAATRAKAAGAGTFAPAPPADSISAPWLEAFRNGTPPPPIPPATVRQTVEVVTRPPTPKTAPKGKARAISDVPTRKIEDAWTLAHAMLKDYGREIDTNLPRADLHLAQALMKNGTLLLRYGVQMDALGALIRLARDLAHQAGGEAQERPEIEALRKSMERNESTIPPLPEIGEDEEQGEEDA